MLLVLLRLLMREAIPISIELLILLRAMCLRVVLFNLVKMKEMAMPSRVLAKLLAVRGIDTFMSGPKKMEGELFNLAKMKEMIKVSRALSLVIAVRWIEVLSCQAR